MTIHIPAYAEGVRIDADSNPRQVYAYLVDDAGQKVGAEAPLSDHAIDVLIKDLTAVQEKRARIREVESMTRAAAILKLHENFRFAADDDEEEYVDIFDKVVTV